VNARPALLTVSALLATTLASCGTLNRAGKDVFLGALTPVLIVYGGATDGYSTAQSVRKGMDTGGVVEVLAFPFTFMYHAFEHTLYGCMHIIDLPLCLFYGAAELHPSGPEVMPLDIYQGTWFDSWAGSGKPTGTDAQTGETQKSGESK
jgi:predicted small secreted protein